MSIRATSRYIKPKGTRSDVARRSPRLEQCLLILSSTNVTGNLFADSFRSIARRRVSPETRDDTSCAFRESDGHALALSPGITPTFRVPSALGVLSSPRKSSCRRRCRRRCHHRLRPRRRDSSSRSRSAADPSLSLSLVEYIDASVSLGCCTRRSTSLRINHEA